MLLYNIQSSYLRLTRTFVMKNLCIKWPSFVSQVHTSCSILHSYVMKFVDRESQTKALLSKNNPTPTFTPGPCLTCARRQALGIEAKFSCYRKTNMTNVAPVTADMEAKIANAVPIKEKSGIKDVPSRTSTACFCDKKHKQIQPPPCTLLLQSQCVLASLF